MRTKLLALLLAAGIGLTGCAGIGGSTGAGADPVEGTRAPAKQYRYVDYDDIYIPNELDYKAEDSFFIGTGSDKLGLMKFTGRVEFRSLATALTQNMVNDGWTLNFNFISSPRSVLIFSKATRFCVMKIYDGTTRTELLVDVYPVKGQERVMRPVAAPPSGTSGMDSPSDGGVLPLREQGLSQ